MASTKIFIACIACAAFTDIASSYGLSYWISYSIAVVCFFAAGWAARRMKWGSYHEKSDDA